MTADTWDDILNQEDNPYDNPFDDDNFSCPDNAYKTGYAFAHDCNGDAVDFETEIEFPTMATNTAIKAFKKGFDDGCRKLIDETYGEDNSEEKYNPMVYTGDDDEDYENDAFEDNDLEEEIEEEDDD